MSMIAKDFSAGSFRLLLERASATAATQQERDELRDFLWEHADKLLLQAELTEGKTRITCVYCGHAYPADSAAHGVPALYEHAKGCTHNPMARIRRAVLVAIRKRLILLPPDSRKAIEDADAFTADDLALNLFIAFAENTAPLGERMLLDARGAELVRKAASQLRMGADELANTVDEEAAGEVRALAGKLESLIAGAIWGMHQ